MNECWLGGEDLGRTDVERPSRTTKLSSFSHNRDVCLAYKTFPFSLKNNYFRLLDDRDVTAGSRTAQARACRYRFNAIQAIWQRDLSLFLQYVYPAASYVPISNTRSSGSPLNRLSFLRSEPAFLSSALKHPTSRVVVLNQLAPLVRSPAELHFSSYQDVKSLVPEDIFEKPEVEVLRSFNSGITPPLVVFLGLDDSKSGDDGMTYKSYKGVPYFAVDVTPKGSLEQKANGIIETLESSGLSFDKARVMSALSADHGM